MSKYKLKTNIKKRLLIVIGCFSIIIGIVFGYRIIILEKLEQELKSFPKDEEIDDNYRENISSIDNADDNHVEDDPDNIDVLAIGNSDMYSAFNPLQLWHEHGITSFVAAGPMQNMKLSYCMLKKILTVQKPKLIIIETANFFEKREEIDRQGYKYTAMKYSYSLFKKTDEWQNIKKESYLNDKSLRNRIENQKGYYFNQKVESNSKDFSYMKMTKKREQFPAITQMYLPKIMSLIKEYDISVLFVCFPTATTGSYARHNMVSDYAKENGIPFLDFNVDQYGTGFDWHTDSRDGGNHLNYSGALKMTKYLGEYLSQNYNFVDKRDNSLFHEWNDAYQKLMKRVK